LATLAAYQPAWNGKLLWDDDINITAPGLRSLDGLARIWTHPGATLQYYPLAHSILWLEYRLWGASPLGYHLLNILLHVLSALLLVRILRRLDIRGAWLAGGIFALHPVMVESVAWISQFTNVLSGVFFLGAVLAYWAYLEAGKRRWYVLSLGLFFLGLLSKTSIAPFPLAMLALVWWKRGRISPRRDIVPLLPFAVAGTLFGLITIHVENTLVAAGGREFGLSPIDRSLIVGRAIWHYLAKVVLPVDLSFIYPRWSVNGAVWWQYLFPAAVLALGAVLWVLRRHWRAPLAAFLYFAAMLLPVIGLFDVYAFRYSWVADHWQYLAAIGPIAVGAGLFGQAKASKRALTSAVAATLLLTLGVLSWKQGRLFADAETLYRTTIRKNADCWLAYNNLGVLMANAGRTDEAIAQYRKALEIHPSYAKAHFNLGNVLATAGRPDEAIAQYEKAVQLDRNYINAHIRLGNMMLQAGRTDEAIAHYARVTEISPQDDRAHASLGDILYQNERMDEAIAHYRRALEINPKLVEALRGLGNVMLKSKRTDEAIARYTMALEIDPNEVGTLQNLAFAFVQEEQWADAFSVLERALASAKSPSDQARVRRTWQILTKLREAVDSSGADTSVDAQ
jgi:tetratricopeptide (TPR) repeat protein